MRQNRTRLTVIALALLLARAASADPMKVTFLSPDPPENIFWGNVIDFMKAVAEDLNIELDVVISGGNSSYALKRDGLEIINRREPPDYLLTGYWNGATDRMFEAAAGKDIGFFVFNTNISAAEQRKVGEPRTRYPGWIGHMRPDDVKAGDDLAGLLAERARTQRGGDKEAIRFAALSGTSNSAVATERVTGLKDRIGSTADLVLTDVIHTTWYRETAEKATETLLRQHPDLSVIWTVGDALALGAADTLKANGLTPGTDVFVGGIDWSDQGIKAVKRGELVATMGGHFMEGGWALLLTHDYHNGHDFAEELGTSIVTQMQAITGDNVDQYLNTLSDRNWSKVDFKQFSKQYNPALDEYNFSLEALLENAEAADRADTD